MRDGYFNVPVGTYASREEPSWYIKVGMIAAAGTSRTIDPIDLRNALTDGTPLSILGVAMTGPVSVRQISEQAGLPVATVYRHVHELVERGLMVRARSAISPQGKRYDLFSATISSANLNVSRAGVTVSWDHGDLAPDDRGMTL